MELTQQLFIDVGTIQTEGGTQTTLTSIQKLTNNSYIFGANFFSFNLSLFHGGFDFSVQNQTLSVLGSSSMVNISYFNIRVRECPTEYPFYFLDFQKCYAQCPGMSFSNSTYNFCYPCHYTCDLCPDATACTACNASNFRYLVGSNCTCMPGYFESGVAKCIKCLDGCSECTNILACQTCNTSAGYSPSSTICVCNSSSYSDGSMCQTCSSALEWCTSCISATVCTSC